ncbi:AMP-dependent synthetase/ligase [Natribacillus halophilus]|uniref:Long-chain acyl-CoA synthetase n=1 Tax=Natribacillus halophilus TaxID=549003 RepID=A0A1G8KJ49_9BACI|nr:long-chain fatty acid--CoA ligase [Natribacillus halophilus]SDI42900.1 long-chain acyl-CoA synthetase [Natribacillus halophilus]
MDPKNLLEMLSQTVERYSEKDALMWKQDGSYVSMTYQALWDRIRNLAAGLARLGVNPGDKVAILSNSNQMWAISDFAIGSLGAVSVPVYPTIPYNQVSYVLKNGDCTIAIVENDEQLQKVRDGDAELQHAIVMEPGPDFTATGHVSSLASLEKDGAIHPLNDWEERWKAIAEDQLMTIIHTSGTTGEPKGVMLSHENFLSNMKAIQFWLIELKPEDVQLSYLPLSHVFERLAGHYMPLSVGTTIAYAESIDTIQDNMQEVQPTIMTSVPRLFEKVYARVVEQVEGGSPVKRKMFNWALDVGGQRYDYYLNTPVQEMLLNKQMPKKLQRHLLLADRLVYQKIKQRLGGRMRSMVVGGGTLNPDIARFFWSLDIPILEGYGLTETSPVVTTNPITRAKVGTTGKPLPNVKVRIASDGEVLVKGPNVMQGYYKNQEATDKDIVDGWLHTGDIGSLDEEGYLKIIDRKKRMLVLSTGKNVAPAPVESVINESSYIEFAAVVGDGRQYVIALVTPDMENLLPWAKQQGMDVGSRAELCKRDEVQQLLTDEVARLTQSHADYEQPKKVVVVKDEWTVDSGELTPKLSLKMNHILEKYKSVIEETYDETSVSEREVAAGT